ncbi:hypothetical protein O6H91_02G155900 [Diphasiastrum complanatum]|uniref:Uncharacterized protein n=1 Tax=Diphasiastrum complanatum TaxID=34168 RepID=A0ACC2EMC6_DIPCM|nr:hypothetical protein O6H91_02G155900 [Diphasiastrum complanatum]
METMNMSLDNAVRTVIAIYKPKEQHTVEEVVNASLRHSDAVKSLDDFIVAAVVKSLDNSYVGSYAHWRKDTDLAANLQIPELAPMLTEMNTLADIDAIDSEVISGESESEEPPVLAKGDILHIAIFTTEPENQEKLVALCQDFLKAQVQDVKGLKACTMHRSLDGKKVLSIGQWKDAATAIGVATSSKWEEANKLLDGLIIDSDSKLYEVVYVK